MIVTRLQDCRQFVGQLDPGQDIVGGLRVFCRENGVKTAWLTATAALKNPTVLAIRPDGLGFGEPIEAIGTFLFSAIHGNVSLVGDTDEVRLYGTAGGPDGVPVAAGLIRAGEVAMCEFLAVVGEMSLVRRVADPATFAPWVQVQSGSITAAPVAVLSTPGYMSPFPSHQRLPPDEAETNELIILDIRNGDFLDHARFGLCRVVNAPKDEKVTVRLASGKQVDLHLGVMTIHPAKEVGGKRVFQLEVRRRA